MVLRKHKKQLETLPCHDRSKPKKAMRSCKEYNSVVAKFATTAADGKTYKTDHYNYEEIYQTLGSHEDEYLNAINSHIGRNIDELNIQKFSTGT